MKILMINKFLYSRGGAENYMLKLSECLNRLGHDVQYFGMYDEKNTVGNSLGLYTMNMDFHSGTLKRFIYPFKIIYSLESRKKLGAVLDDFKPDIVHMNNINFQLTPSMIYEIKKRGIPLVQTVHDYQMICPNHLMYRFDENKICEKCLRGSKWNCAKYSCIHNSKIKSIIGSIEAILYRSLGTYKMVDKYICPSYFLENQLLSSGDTYKGKTCTIHNFIEKTDTKGVTENYVAFAGRISMEKGINLIAEAAKLLPECKFVVAGSGPDEKLLHGIENVHMTGFLTGDKLINVMANCKVLVVPSVWYENCPLSILEAQSMGVPVIAMNSGGMAELITDGVNGVLVDTADAKSLAEAIRKTVCDDEFYAELKSSCEKHSKNIYEVDEYCDMLMNVYNEVISGGNS